MFPEDDFTLTLGLAGNSIWKSYDFGMFHGMMHLEKRPWSSSYKKVWFTCRERNESEGEMSFGPNCTGWIQLYGEGRNCSQLNCYGNARFSGQRIMARKCSRRGVCRVGVRSGTGTTRWNMIMRIDGNGEGGRRCLASLVNRHDPLRRRVIRQQNRSAAVEMQSKRQWASAVQILDTRSMYSMIIRWRIHGSRYPLVYWSSYILY